MHHLLLSVAVAACGVVGVVLAGDAQAPVQPANAPAPTQAAPAQEAAPAETQPKAWPGTFAEGFDAMRDFAGKQQLESARTVADALLAPNSFLRWKLDFAARGGWRRHLVDAADPVLDAAGWNGLEPDVRAEIVYAKGVIAMLGKDRETAEADLWKARGMSSDASLQQDSVYDLGVLALAAGEEARAKLPEVSGQPAAQPVAPAPGAGAATQGGTPGATPPPDPLQIARAEYMQARERFVERLRSRWDDADTQANVELCLKRLRELDEIEKKRKEEEEKKKQEQQKKDQQKKDQDKQDKDKKDQENKDKPEDQKDQKDQSDKDESKKEPDKPKDEDKKPEDKDQKDKQDKDKKKDAQPTEAKDETMSQAEMTQLLDRLQRIEDEHKRIEAQLKAMRRAKVKKDW